MDGPIRNKDPRKGQNGGALHYISWNMLGIKCQMQSLSWKWSNKPLAWPSPLNDSLVTFPNALSPGFKLRENAAYLVKYLNNRIHSGKWEKEGNKKSLVRYLLFKLGFLKCILWCDKPDTKSSIHTGCIIVLLRCFPLWVLTNPSPPSTSNRLDGACLSMGRHFCLVSETKETPPERKEIWQTLQERLLPSWDIYSLLQCLALPFNRYFYIIIVPPL